jgi:hypothetical protein
MHKLLGSMHWTSPTIFVHIDSAEFLNYIDISLKIFGFFMRKADCNSQICELCCLLSMDQFYIVWVIFGLSPCTLRN